MEGPFQKRLTSSQNVTFRFQGAFHPRGREYQQIRAVGGKASGKFGETHVVTRHEPRGEGPDFDECGHGVPGLHVVAFLRLEGVVKMQFRVDEFEFSVACDDEVVVYARFARDPNVNRTDDGDVFAFGRFHEVVKAYNAQNVAQTLKDYYKGAYIPAWAGAANYKL